MGWPKKVLRTFKFKLLNKQREFLKEAKRPEENKRVVSFLFVYLVALETTQTFYIRRSIVRVPT